MKFLKFISLLGILGFLFFAHIGSRPLANPDEGRYASMGSYIVQSGDWIVPHLNGLVYFEKPPLGYWMIALGEKLLGTTLVGARCFNALCSLLTCCVLYCFCKRFLSAKIGLWAALIYGTAGLAFGMSQMLTLDNLLTFCLTTTLILFASGFLEPDDKWSHRYFIGAYVFMGLSIMTKGLIGIVFPALIGLPWLICTGSIKQWSKMHWLQGIGIVLLITAPWHILVQIKHDGFAHFYFWHEHFERYTTSVHARTKPWYFLPNSFILGLMPWALFLPRALIQGFKSARSHPFAKPILVFSLLWSSLILGFFSCSHSQLIPYILPAIAGIIPCIAYGFANTDWKQIRLECGIWGLSFLTASCILPHIVAKRAFIPVPAPLRYTLQALLILGTCGSLVFLKRHPKASFNSLLITTIGLYSVFPAIMPYFQRLNGYAVSQYLKQCPSKDAVFCAYNYFNDLPFYLQHTIGTINCIPEEHQFGYNLDKNERYTTIEQFKTLWGSKRPYYAVVKRNEEERFEADMQGHAIYILTKDPFFTLYSNQP